MWCHRAICTVHTAHTCSSHFCPPSMSSRGQQHGKQALMSISAHTQAHQIYPPLYCVLCVGILCCLYTYTACMYYTHTVSLYTVQRMYVLYTYCVPIYCTTYVCTIHILCPYILYNVCMYYTHTVSLYTVQRMYVLYTYCVPTYYTMYVCTIHILCPYILYNVCMYYTHTVSLYTLCMHVCAIIYSICTYIVYQYILYVLSNYVCNRLIYSNIPPHLSAPGRSLLQGNQQLPRLPSTDSGSSVHVV